MAQHVDTFEVSVDIDGIKGFAVQGFSLDVAVNSLPSITIEALPISRPDTGTRATAPTFEDLTKLYNQLSSEAIKRSKKATITIKTISTEKNENDTLELKDWILTDAGLSSVTNYSAPTLTVVFHHPIIKLETLGPIYEKLQNAQYLREKFLSYENLPVLDIMQRVYELFGGNGGLEFFKIASTANGGPQGNMKSIIQNVRTELSNVKLNEYIKSDAGQFLAGVGDADALKCINAAIADMVQPRPFGNSIWMTIIGSVCPNMIMNVVPTYDQKQLLLEPYNPWQECTLFIDSNKVEAIDMTSMDPDPIYALAIDKRDKISNWVTGDATRPAPTNQDALKLEDFGFAFYFPDKAMASRLEDLPGRIEYYNGNDIVYNAKGWGFKKSTVGKMTEHDQTFSDQTEEKMLSKIAEAVFNGNYRKHCKATITTVPSFKDANDQMIYPGRVMTIKDWEDGELFYGYLSRMTIRGTTEGGGSASYELMTARPTDSSSTLIDKVVEKNPCF